MRSGLVACALVLGATSEAAAERPDLRVDVEPAAYVLRGYSVHLRVETPWVERLVAGAGAYGFDVPQLMVDLAPGNRDEEWSVRLTFGANVFADYFVGGPVDRGWLVGAQVGMQRFRVRHAGDEQTAATVIAMVRAGYEWHPWPRGFYLFPWLGAAINVAGDEPEVGGEVYDVAPVVPYGAVELGWRF